MLMRFVASGDIILVGINYDKRTKRHECVIVKVSGDVAINVAINQILLAIKIRNGY